LRLPTNKMALKVISNTLWQTKYWSSTDLWTQKLCSAAQCCHKLSMKCRPRNTCVMYMFEIKLEEVKIMTKHLEGERLNVFDTCIFYHLGRLFPHHYIKQQTVYLTFTRYIFRAHYADLISDSFRTLCPSLYNTKIHRHKETQWVTFVDWIVSLWTDTSRMIFHHLSTTTHRSAHKLKINSNHAPMKHTENLND